MPSTELATFIYTDHPIRMVGDDNEPWFVLSDICAVLSIQNVTQAARRLDEDETKRDLVVTTGGEQSMILVNEFGLYELMLTSRALASKPFKQWIKREVLPAIRKTGRYLTPEAVKEVQQVRREVQSTAASVRRSVQHGNATAALAALDSLVYAVDNEYLACLVTASRTELP